MPFAPFPLAEEEEDWMIVHRAWDLRFTWLFYSLVIMLASYPSFQDTATGAALGGFTALLILGAGLYAVRGCRRIRVVSGSLALLSLGASILSLAGQTRGSVWTEASFTAFYAVTTVTVLVEVIRLREFDMDAILGAVSVYLLIGFTFGSLYDLLETIEPGSFRASAAAVGEVSMGFRRLLFFSFMTLTSIGYGDIVPVTDRAQSLAILEGVAGVLYVAVLVGGVVNAYQQGGAARRSAPGNG